MPDFFLDGAEKSSGSPSPKARRASSPDKASNAGVSYVDSLLSKFEMSLSEDIVKKTLGIVKFELSGAQPGIFFLDLKNGKGQWNIYR